MKKFIRLIKLYICDTILSGDKMKKIMFMLILLCIFITNVNALSSYSINIPNTFTSTKENYYEKETETDKTSIYIFTTDNKEGLNINNYNDKSLENANYVEKIKEDFKPLNKSHSVDASDIKLDYINNYRAIVLNITSSIELDSKNRSMVYQRQYVTSSKNYIYYVTISSTNNNYLDSDELSNILSTFKINDELLKKTYDLKKYYIVLTALILLGPVIGFIFYKRKI